MALSGRTTLISNMGTAVVTANNTFVGTGGVMNKNSTAIISGNGTITNYKGLNSAGGTAIITSHGTITSGAAINPAVVTGLPVSFVYSGTYSATQAAVALKYSPSASTNVAPWMPKGGSIIGVGCRLSAAMNASDKPVTVKIWKGATSLAAAHVTLTQPARNGYTNLALGAATFGAGTSLRVKVTNSTVASATLTLGVTLFATI